MPDRTYWTLFRVTASAFPPAVGASIGIAGVLTLAGVLWVIHSPGSIFPEMWVLGRAWGIWSIFWTLLAWSDKTLMSVADWPLLRLTGQDANLFRGLTLPAALQAAAAHVATAAFTMLIAPQFGGVAAMLWLEGVALALGAALSFGTLQLRIWNRVNPKVIGWIWTTVVLGIVSAQFFGYSILSILSWSWQTTAMWLSLGWLFPATCVAIAGVGYFYAEWRFGHADERAASTVAMQFSAPGTAIQPKQEKARVRPSKRLRGRRPITELVVQLIRPGMWRAAGAGLVLITLIGFVLPTAANAVGYPGIDVLNPTLGVAVGLALAGYGFCAALTSSMIAERALRERWLPDIFMAVEARQGVRELTRGCFACLIPLLWFSVAVGAIFLATGGDVWVVGAWALAFLAAAAGGFLLSLAAVALTLKHPAKGWSQLWRMAIGFVVLPIALVYTPFYYLKMERLIESEPGTLDVVK